MKGNVLERLNQIKKLDQSIDAKLAESTRLRAMATDISPRPMDGIPFSNTGMVPRKMEDAVIKLVMLGEETDKLIDEYIKQKKAIVSTLEKLPEKEFGVLHRYYIRNMTIEEIAEDMGYCTVQIWRIKKNGLKILQDVMECNAKSV